MAIWLGNAGIVKLQRSWQNEVFDHITPGGVNPGQRRFGFEDGVTGITTGDRIQFKRVDEDGKPVEEPLDFVDPSGWIDNVQRNDGAWYCSSDSVGSVRLFDKWEDALTNDPAKAIELQAPSERYRVECKNANGNEHCLAQITSWTLNTNRETADVSGLGDQFRKQYSGMISGSGSIECFFDYDYHVQHGCEKNYEQELPVFMHKLAVRQEVGSTFTGLFLMRQSSTVPIDSFVDPDRMEDELFYLCDCLVTNVATELSPTAMIRSTIEFVTTGKIQLLYAKPAEQLMLEGGGGLLLQDDRELSLNALDLS